MGGLRRVQMGGLFFTRLRLIFCRKVTSKVCLGMGGFLAYSLCRNYEVKDKKMKQEEPPVFYFRF